MKKLLFCLIASVFSGFCFAAPNTDASQKVVDVFNQDFADVKDVSWIPVADGFTAVFQQNGIRTNITYDKDGRFLSSRRYYSESNLPFNVVLKIKEKYKGKTIGIVTEVIEDNQIVYSVNLEDTENFYVVESGSNANLHLARKFKKQPYLQ